jgi:Na+-driven multidrug efflux pump
MGAALGTLVAYIVTFVLMQVYLRILLGVNPLAPFAYMMDFYVKIWNIAKLKLNSMRLQLLP